MSSHQWYRAAATIGLAAVVMVGCASVPKPTDQMAVSNAAISSAVNAGGSQYAPVEMSAATVKMERARQAMDREDYESARWLAEQAQADAKLAEKKAESAKAQKAAMVVSDDIRILRDEINRKSK